MIEVTRLNGSIYFLNPDMILTIEETPDTVITLNSGEKLLAKEPPSVLIDRFLTIKRCIYASGPTVLERKTVELPDLKSS